MLRSLITSFLLVSALLSAGIDCAHSAAWLRTEGQSKIIFSTVWTGANQRFDGAGKPVAAGAFSKVAAQTIVEHGLTLDITVIAGLAGQQQRLISTPLLQGSTSGAGLAGARLRLWSNDQTILSFQATSEISGEHQNKLSQNRRFEPPATADFRVLLGHNFSLHGLPSFIDLQGGYRWRGGSHADEIRLDTTLGIRAAPKILLLLQAFNTVATERDKRFVSKAARQHKLQASLVYELTQNVSLQIGGFASVAGQESLRERGALLALWWKI